MTGVLVPLVPRTTFVFDDLQPGSSVSTALVRGMPLYAWLSAVFLVRIDANSMVAGAHALGAQARRTAPTPEDPGEDFDGSLVTVVSVLPATAEQVVLFGEITEKPWPPFADLVVQQTNGGATAEVGSVTLSIDVIVRGRAFDRVDPGAGRRDARASGARP